jgi:hypothetical protein
MSGVNSVCQSVNIKTGTIPKDAAQGLELASDLIEFYKVFNVVESAERAISQVGRFSRRAARTYSRNQEKVKAEIGKRDEPFNLPSPIEQVITVLNKTIEAIRYTPRGRAGNARDREGFEKLLTYYNNIQSSMRLAKANVSAKGWQTFETIWSGVQESSQIDRLKTAIQQRIRSLRSRLKYQDPHEFIRQTCSKYRFVIKPPKPPTSRPIRPKTPKPSRFSWGARLWAGFGKDVLGTLAAGASAEYKISQSLRLRLDYDFYAAYDFGSDLVTNDDLAMVSIVGNSYFAQAGFRYYRNDRPTLVRPDQHMAVLSGGKSFSPKDNFSIDLAGTFQIGSADYGDPHLQAKLLGSAGISYRSGMFTISPSLVGGAILEEAAKQEIVGGELKASLDLGRFGLDLKGYGMGYPGEQSHIGWMLQGNISIAKNWNILISAGPGEFASDGDNSTVSFSGGLGIAYGLSGAGPRPLLFEPIHYIIGSNNYGVK